MCLTSSLPSGPRAPTAYGRRPTRRTRSGALAAPPGADDGQAHREERDDAPTQQSNQAEQDQSAGPIEQRRQPGQPRHRLFERAPAAPSVREAPPTDPYCPTGSPPRPAAAAAPTRDRAKAAAAPPPRGSGASAPADPSTDPSAAVASSPGRISTSRDIGACNSASARIDGSRPATRPIGSRRSATPFNVGSSPATAVIGSRSRSTPCSAGTSATVDAVDCLIVSLLAAMAAVLARMFSLFSRRVIASEQPPRHRSSRVKYG